MLASLCWIPGRIEEAVGYADAGQTVIGSGGDRCRSASRARSALCTWSSASPNERSSGVAPSSHAAATPIHSPGHCLVVALTVAGAGEEARAAANGLIEAAEATHNPYALAYALHAYGYAFRDADPVRALEALRRGLVIAQDSGNRFDRITAGDRFVSA